MKQLKLFARLNTSEVIPLTATECDGYTRYTLAAKLFENASTVCIESDDFIKIANDKGYYLLPGETNSSGSAKIGFKKLDNDELITVCFPTLNYYAVNNGEATYVMAVEHSYIYNLKAEYKNGKYNVSLVIETSKNLVEDDFGIKVITLGADADHNGIAKSIRDLRLKLGEIRPLSEKMTERPELKYAADHPLIRIRMGWKPVPPNIEEQTLANEPQMFVACTFERVREFADALRNAGVEGAEISLVGWNQKGHDGRWPQIFPVEEALGGEEELIKTIKHVQSLGYAITCHTNTTDHYYIADSFSKAQLLKNKDGSFNTHGVWAGGRAYSPCPITQYEYAKRDLPKVAALGFRGLHYIDCISICRPESCFDQNHRSTIANSILMLRRIMELSRDLFGGFSSEGIKDFTLGELDFSLYNRFRSNLLPFSPKDYKMVDEVIPMEELIYHGITLYNPSSATINATVKPASALATVMLLGGRPSLYVYSKFVTKKDKPLTNLGDNWMGEEDLRIDTEEELTRSVEAVRRFCDVYAPYRKLQGVFIKSYDSFENGIRVVTYEDGTTVAANLGTDTAEYCGKLFKPYDYAII